MNMTDCNPPVGQIVDGWRIIGRVPSTRSWNVSCVACGHERAASGIVVGKALTGVTGMSACEECCAPAYVLGDGSEWNGWDLVAEPDAHPDEREFAMPADDRWDDAPGTPDPRTATAIPPDRCAPDDDTGTIDRPTCDCLTVVADMFRAALHVIGSSRPA